IGDTVNVAARIEGLTKTAGVPVLVSAATRSRAGAGYTFHSFEPMSVRGKSEPMETFSPSRDMTARSPSKAPGHSRCASCRPVSGATTPGRVTFAFDVPSVCEGRHHGGAQCRSRVAGGAVVDCLRRDPVRG